jgi:hypothetical protein
MVPAQSSGTVDLTTGTVEGDPVPAEELKDQEILVDHPRQTGSEAADRAADRAEDREREKAEKAEKDAEERARQAEAPAADAELDGGSLPAPQQRTPGE